MLERIDELTKLGADFGFETTLSGRTHLRRLLQMKSDGYRAVFALPELDPAFTDAIVLLADRRDGPPRRVPLP